jgi:hypothetical protein
MAGKTPGTPRKSTSSRKSTAKKTSSVTPIDQSSTVNTDGGFTQAGGAGEGKGAAQLQKSAQRQNSAQNGNAGANQGSSRGAETTGRTNETASARSAEISSRPAGPELVERIRARAYELFELRGRREGFDQEDWAQAEAEVLARFEREKSA